MGQTLVELSPISKCMQDSLKKHLPRLAVNPNDLVYLWGHETQKLFTELREKDFINIKDIHFLSLKKVLKTYKISIPTSLARTIVGDVWQNFIDNNKLYPDSIPVLNQLKQSDYKLGIITDCDSDVASGIIRKHNLTNIFDVKVISSVIKAYKPNPLLFSEAIKLAKCSSDEGIYVGDSEIDIKGAKEIGMISIIIKRDTPHKETPHPIKSQSLPKSENEIKNTQPDFIINSLFQLIPIIKNIYLEKISGTIFHESHH